MKRLLKYRVVEMRLKDRMQERETDGEREGGSCKETDRENGGSGADWVSSEMSVVTHLQTFSLNMHD